MGDLTLNKILGSLLAVALVLFGLNELSKVLFSDGGGYGHYGEELSYNERIAQKFAYFIPVEGAGEVGEEEEEVFDLGLALASADISRGERSFNAKCATCHTIDEGGAHGTGPNLWATIGLDKAGHEGFNYSRTLEGMEGEWTYQTLNDWLYNPSAYAPGTSMAFAGLRRDDERANVIAYLAAYTPDPAPFPAPVTADDSGETEDSAAQPVANTPSEADAPMPAAGEVTEVLEEASEALEGGAATVAEGAGLADDTDTTEEGGE